MKRIRALNRYQKGVLLSITFMVLLFTVLYPVTRNRVGYSYRGAILMPSEENGSVVYSGRIQWQQARFTVSADHTVEFQYGDQTYGPYTAIEDPTAVPEDEEAHQMTGVEVRCGDELLFRGGVEKGDESWYLYNEDGWLTSLSYFKTPGRAVVIEGSEGGKEVERVEPSVINILQLMDGPELTHKGVWMGWFFGVVFCAITAIFLLYADDIFYWKLSLSIRNAEQAVPSDWERKSRYIAWTLLPILALVAFILGLQF